MRKRFLLAAVMLTAAPAQGQSTIGQQIRQAELLIERFGTNVVWSKPLGHRRCSRSRGLMGYFDPVANKVTMCQQNHRGDMATMLDTIQHEGWHAAQMWCNNMQPVLTDDQIREYLSVQDRRDLKHYKQYQHRQEAEARAVAKLPHELWAKGVRSYCAHLL